MATIATILERKGHRVHCVQRHECAQEALMAMLEHGVKSLIVVDEVGPCGILTQRHYLERVVLENRQADSTRVEEIMDSRVSTIPPDCTPEACMDIMSETQLRQLPVMDGEDLVGIVSAGDVVKYMVDEHRDEIRSLNSYISGRYPG